MVLLVCFFSLYFWHSRPLHIDVCTLNCETIRILSRKHEIFKDQLSHAKVSKLLICFPLLFTMRMLWLLAQKRWTPHNSFYVFKFLVILQQRHCFLIFIICKTMMRSALPPPGNISIVKTYFFSQLIHKKHNNFAEKCPQFIMVRSKSSNKSQ